MIQLDLHLKDEPLRSSPKISGYTSPMPKPQPIESPLTPTSHSLKGTNSDVSETASKDTVPSSIHDDAPHNESAQTLTHPKTSKDSELDHATMTETAAELPVLSPTVHASVDPHDPSPVEGHSPGPTDPHRAGYKIHDSKTSIHPGKLSAFRRHTSPGPPSASRDSLRSHVQPPLARTQTFKHASKKLHGSERDKSTSIVEPRNSRNHSAPEATASELTRMRNVLIKRNYQKRKDLDDDNVLLGNKISEGHENFVMAYNMLTGIRVMVSRCAGVMKKLNDADFKVSTKLTFSMDGSELTPSTKYDFKFKDYCPEVFRELRTLFGIDPADYLMSITGKYILSELGSPGKSGSFFYYSRDFRFIIKTIHHSEHKQLRRILKDYYNHVRDNPNTLISQFYGLHRLKVHGGMKKVHFIVMNNLFPPHRDIHLKYDLKGSTWGRYTRVDKDTDLSNVTLKDLNWLERGDKIKLGPDKKKMFIEQLESDVKLLKKINVMDYSLLLGVHDVKKGNSDLLTKLSVFDPKSNLKAEVFKTNPRDIDRGIDLPTDVFPGRSKYIFYGHNGGMRATNENNDPLPEIYYLGIIDCLTNYSLKKRLETFWRSLSHQRSTISALPAQDYGNRFLRFIKDGIAGEKLKKN